MAADSNTSDGWSVEVLHSIHGVAPATWDTLVGDGCPFFEHAFLAAVEDAACVGPGTGWAPRHLLLRDTAAGGSAVAAVAAWEKRNSNAEF
ncbi:MAG TPA: peptidogalycan biosysnthesis protein, partial [Rhodocyclaceae bacterium]|nr:peptidogalycan biosysnthesis protein [Rhodocyclaceae bacterium]